MMQNNDQYRHRGGFLGARFITVNMDQMDCFGTLEAIILETFDYRLRSFERRDFQTWKGRHWVIQTANEWHKTYFKGFSKSTFLRLVKELEEKGLVFSRKTPWKEDMMQRTWYSLNYPRIAEVMEEYMEKERLEGSQARNPMEDSPKDLPGEGEVAPWTDETEAENTVETPLPKMDDPRVSRIIDPGTQDRGPMYNTDIHNKEEKTSIKHKVKSEFPEKSDSAKPEEEIQEEVTPVAPEEKAAFLSSRKPEEPLLGDIQTLRMELAEIALPLLAEEIRPAAMEIDKPTLKPRIECFTEYLLLERGKQSLQRISKPEGGLQQNIYQGLLTYFRKRWQNTIDVTQDDISLALQIDWRWWIFITALGFTQSIRSTDWKKRNETEKQLDELLLQLQITGTTFFDYSRWLYTQSGLQHISVDLALVPRTIESYASTLKPN